MSAPATGWQVAATEAKRRLTYRVSVRNQQRAQQRQPGCAIVSPARLRIFRLSGPPALSVVNELTPSPYHRSLIRNEGGTAGTTYMLAYPSHRPTAPGERRDKFVGTIDAGAKHASHGRWFRQVCLGAYHIRYQFWTVENQHSRTALSLCRSRPGMIGEPDIWPHTDRTRRLLIVWATNVANLARAELDSSLTQMWSNWLVRH